MNVTKSDVEAYLSDVFAAVNAGRYQISPRPKNQNIYIDYVFTEADARNVILSLTADDFSEAVQNDHPQHPEEIKGGHKDGKRENPILCRMQRRNNVQNTTCSVYKMY